jgi:tetratricopeptide (TPR) repeat protein
VYGQQGNFDGALQDANAAVKLKLNDIDVLLARARLYALKGDTARALADLNKVLGLDSSNTEARVLRARLYNHQHWTNEAIGDLNKVLALTPQDAASYKARAELLRQLGDNAGAQADLDRALALEPGNTELLLRQASLMEQQQKWDAALALYGNAINTNPAPDLYVHVGKIRYNLGQYRRALANFQAALERNKDLSTAYQGVGLAQRQLANFPAAIVAFKHYLQLVPSAPDRAEIEAWIQKHGG